MKPIAITVARADGEVTRLDGQSGMAVCTPGLESADVMPATAFRCSSKAELAWNLAALMAGVRHLAPEAFETALGLMDRMNFTKPVLRHELPRPERD